MKILQEKNMQPQNFFNPTFWKGKKVLITGHTGFKGNWLSLVLRTMGAKVIGYSLPMPPKTYPNLFFLLKNDELENSDDEIVCDVRDYNKLTDMIKKYQPEIVFHLSAQPLLYYSNHFPYETISTNVKGTANLLQVIVDCGDSVRSIVNITTDKCYQNLEKTKTGKTSYDIDSPKASKSDTYSNSKANSEYLAEMYRKVFEEKNEEKRKNGRPLLAIATARAGNVIAGGDWSETRIIPNIVKVFKGDIIPEQATNMSIEASSNNDNKKIPVYNTNATRPWLHVLDAISGYVLLAEKLYCSPIIYSGAWNFGPEGKGKTVKWLCEKMCHEFDKSYTEYFEEKNTSEARCEETEHLSVDISKTKQVLNWKPCWSMEQNIEKTAAWYKKYYEYSSKRDETVLIQTMYDFTLQQISEFVNSTYNLSDSSNNTRVTTDLIVEHRRNNKMKNSILSKKTTYSKSNSFFNENNNNEIITINDDGGFKLFAYTYTVKLLCSII